jgi:ABC-2 type transport system permease protein
MKELTGTGPLIRLILRRDRITLPLWIILVGIIPLSMAASYQELYPTAQALKEFADLSMSTSATVGMLGFVYAPTVGGLVAWRAGLNGIFLIVPVSILYVVRHTRTEEESGHRDLLGGSPVGRLAPLTAALVIVFGANLLIALLYALGMISQGLPAAGAIIMGLSATLGGCVFASLAALTAQLTENPGPARGISFTIFALAWVMRGVGDLGQSVGRGWLSWISPLGWVRFTRAFADEQWWVLLLPIALTMLLTAAAVTLAARRDVGAGLLPARTGPATAASSLRSPFALAWRTYGSDMFDWSVGIAVFGLLLGNVGSSIEGFVDNPQMQAWAASMGMSSAGDAFLYMIMYVLGQVLSAYAIVSAFQMRSEEAEGRADLVLAAPVSRLRWALSHVIIAALGPTLILLVLGAAIGLGYGLSTGDLAHELPRLLIRTLLTLPAIWVVTGIAVGLHGLLPRLAAPITWSLFAVFLALELGWELQQIDPALFKLSPFSYVHWAIQPTVVALAGLTTLALIFAAAGLFGFQRRDLA